MLVVTRAVPREYIDNIDNARFKNLEYKEPANPWFLACRQASQLIHEATERLALGGTAYLDALETLGEDEVRALCGQLAYQRSNQ